MPAAVDRLQFAPPPPPGMLRALGLALIAHVLLMLALGWGINWKHDPVTLSAEAELWSNVPQEAAPKLAEPPPAPPVPVPVPPPPVVQAEAPKPEPAPREADIAIEREREREKEKKADEKRKQLALEKKREADRHKQLEAKRELEDKRKQELAKARTADDRKKLETAKREQAEKAEKAAEAQRQANIERMKGMAGATGAQTATGNAMRSSGPSDSYAGRIRARVKPNIVFGEEIAGNPTTEIEVRTAPDGTIVGQRIVKPSGVRNWDEAVLKAVIKTEMLPRDVDGRVHSPITLVFRPKD